jgi:hypothetical protein
MNVKYINTTKGSNDPIFGVIIEVGYNFQEPKWRGGEELPPCSGTYYWNEDWGQYYGPFLGEEAARASLRKYAQYLNDGTTDYTK